MWYALLILWHERNRFLPGILAVGFSTLLIALQFGLLLGMFSVVSVPVDRSTADVWVGYPGVQSVDMGLPIPEAWRSRLEGQPEVVRTEPYVEGVVPWPRPNGGVEFAVVVGSHLGRASLGAIADLTPELRKRLTEPGAVVVNEDDLGRLGIRRLGETAEVQGVRVRVVGLVHGIKGLGGVYLFCSVLTARRLLHMRPDQATYLLARCRNPADAPEVARRLRAWPGMSAFTRTELSRGSRMHWLVKTNAGLALGSAALLGLLVGLAITNQTLHAAAVAAAREFAMLEALGIPTRRMSALLVSQAFWVGLFGISLAQPAAQGLAWCFRRLGPQVNLPPWLLAGAAAVTLLMALLSGLLALRSLRLAEPSNLLR
jgi:putative ABC transport system permease protein